MEIAFLQSYLIVQSLGHRNGTTREVGIVILPVAQNDTGRSVAVASQQCEQVVLSAVTSQGDVAQIRWVGTVVGSASRFLVGVRTREVVGQLTRSHEVVAGLIGAVFNLKLAKNNDRECCSCFLQSEKDLS